VARHDDAAVVDDRDAVGELVRVLEVLRREEDAGASADEPADRVPQLDAAGRVEPAVGSSSKRSAGSLARLMVRSSLRRMPPEYVRASRSAALASPRPSRSSSAFVAADLAPRPYSRASMRTFSRPVIAASTAGYWPANPIERRTWAAALSTSCPFTVSVPASMGMSVATARTNVVFPAPLGPRSAITWPRSMTRSMPARAFVAPNAFVTRRASRMLAVIARAAPGA